MSATPLSQEQFVLLIARHERRIRSFIATLVFCNQDAIDEVVQSTYLVAWRKLHSFTYVDMTPDEELIRWMCTIARFEVKDYVRRQRPLHVMFDDELIDRVADAEEQQSDLLEARHAALAQCVSRLPAGQREVVDLRYGHGLSVKELAARQGRQVNAVYTALCRIRKALERCIRQKLLQKGYTS